MSETSIATIDINSFGITPKADVSPEEPIFVLTSSQLQCIITAAVEKATKSILSQVSTLEAITALKTEIVELRAFGEAEIERVCVDIAQDRRRIAQLEQPNNEPTKNQREKISHLRLLIAGNSGKMRAKDARQLLKMDKGNFSRLVAAASEFIETRKSSTDRREIVLLIISD